MSTSTADEYLDLLEFDDPQAPTTTIRRVLYALLAATCRPGNREAEQRAAAMGRGFARLGGYSPVCAWQRIVQEVRAASRSPAHRLRTGHDEAAAERLRQVAREASRLKPKRLKALDYYLRDATLEDLALYHGIL
jgi:hypothetical protein